MVENVPDNVTLDEHAKTEVEDLKRCMPDFVDLGIPELTNSTLAGNPAFKLAATAKFNLTKVIDTIFSGGGLGNLGDLGGLDGLASNGGLGDFGFGSMGGFGGPEQEMGDLAELEIYGDLDNKGW